MEEQSDSFASPESTERLWKFFADQVELLAALKSKAHEASGDTWRVAYTLLFAAHDTGVSLLHVVKGQALRDAYVLARVMFETIVNALFIVAGGDEYAQRALRHARQKSVRDLDREIEAGSRTLFIKWSGADRVVEDPNIQEELDEFTARAGREIREWTPESVRERINQIEERLGKNVTTGLVFGLMLFRHSSDIIHGTLYGALFSLGLTRPGQGPKSKEELMKHYRGELSMLCLVMGTVCHSAIVALADLLEAPELTVQSKKNVSRVRSEPWARDTDE